MTDHGIQVPPRNCDCGKPGVVVQIEVIHLQSGRTRRGAFSEFGEQTSRNKTLILRPEFRFKRWIVECGVCFYDKDQEEMFG